MNTVPQLPSFYSGAGWNRATLRQVEVCALHNLSLLSVLSLLVYCGGGGETQGKMEKRFQFCFGGGGGLFASVQKAFCTNMIIMGWVLLREFFCSLIGIEKTRYGVAFIERKENWTQLLYPYCPYPVFWGAHISSCPYGRSIYDSTYARYANKKVVCNMPIAPLRIFLGH